MQAIKTPSDVVLYPSLTVLLSNCPSAAHRHGSRSVKGVKENGSDSNSEYSSGKDGYHGPLVVRARSEQKLKHTQTGLNGQTILWIIDTGAETDIVGSEVCRKVRLKMKK